MIGVRSVEIVGARGFIGQELIGLIQEHDFLSVTPASLNEQGRLSPDEVARTDASVVVLGLPNGESGPYVDVLEDSKSERFVVDLSADHRFDQQWYYGLPELTRRRYSGQHRISNPGCFATALQLVIEPVRDGLSMPVTAFGVSGHSGAGSKPNPRNDAARLRDNVVPYEPAGHAHEREVMSRLKGLALDFIPSVAPWARGISVVVNMRLEKGVSLAAARALYLERYSSETLVSVVDQEPLAHERVGKVGVEIGGIAVDKFRGRLVVMAALDNLLKGGASQALQNINLALGFDELEGLRNHID